MITRRPLPTISAFPALCALGLLLALPSPSRAADSLGDMMRQSGWEKMIGTWVDEGTGGQVITITYRWRIQDHALAISSKTPERLSEALVGINPESGEVMHVALDDQGGASVGKWSGDEQGNAILELKYTSTDGTGGPGRISQRMEGEDRIHVDYQLASGGSGSIVLVRAEDEEGEE